VKDDRLYLLHILECIQRIESYVSGDREGFMSSTLKQDAVIRNFEIVGEAAKRLSDGFRGLHPDVPWKRMAGFRDILIHNYMGVDLDEVWNITQRELPSLKGKLEEMLAKTG
jgi:uncharacterized protein with HEPN domain